MREFRIYYDGNRDALSRVNKDFTYRIEEEINADAELIASAKLRNKEFAEKVKKIVENPENHLFLATMIEGIRNSIPRYSFYKNVDMNGKTVDIEIDLIDRVFRIIE